MTKISLGNFRIIFAKDTYLVFNRIDGLKHIYVPVYMLLVRTTTTIIKNVKFKNLYQVLTEYKKRYETNTSLYGNKVRL
jgi:hypothetical protein